MGAVQRLAAWAAALVLAVTVGVALPSNATASQAGSSTISGFVPLNPTRILDTRYGSGGITGPVAQGGSATVVVAGRGGVPSTGVGAVAVNLTVADPESTGYLTAWPAGNSRPVTSNLNFVRSTAVANRAVVTLGSGGRISLYSSARTQVIVDVAGYFPVGGDFRPVTPTRIGDTRIGLGLPLTLRPAGSTVPMAVTGRAGVPATGVEAVVVQLTSVAAKSSGYLTIDPSDRPRSSTSVVNHDSFATAGTTMARPGRDGRVNIYTSAATHVLVDVVGWIPSVSTYVGLPPFRLVDSRVGVGTAQGVTTPGGSVTVRPVGIGALPAGGISAVEVVVTAISAERHGSVTVHPAGTARPTSSLLNTIPGRAITNSASVKLGVDGVFVLSASQSSDLIVDVVGYWRADQSLSIATPSLVRAVAGTSYADQVDVRGGTPPYNYSASGLPEGIRIDPSSGILSGSAQTSGTSRFTVRVQDVAGGAATRSYDFTVGAPSNPTGARKVVAGDFHTCALLVDRTVKCWGRNSQGQLGNGTRVDSAVPGAVSGLTDVVDIAAGSAHTCAVLSAGVLKCWGYNAYGTLGNGSTTGSAVPVQVTGTATRVVSVSAGSFHTCARTSDGEAYCWGSGLHGQLGAGTTTDSLFPQRVLSLPQPIRTLVAGSLLTCAALIDGSVWCWGSDGAGAVPTPTVVPGVGATGDLSTDLSAVCAVTGGSVLCWQGSRPTQQNSPRQIDGLGGDAVRLATGGYHSCALLTSGTMRCWGEGRSGQLGDGRALSFLAPVTVVDLPVVVDNIAAGEKHSCAGQADGTVRCWGDNAFGQLGFPGPAPVARPMTVPGIG